MTEPKKPEGASPGEDQTEGRPPEDEAEDAETGEADPEDGGIRTDEETPDDGAPPGEEATEDGAVPGGEAIEEGETPPSETLAAEEPAVIGDPESPGIRREDDTDSGTADVGDASETDAAPSGGVAARDTETETTETAEDDDGAAFDDEEARSPAQEADESSATADEIDPAASDEPRADETAGTEEARAADPEAPPAVPAERVVVERRGGVIPGFIGGVVAVLGAVFAAPYVLPDRMRPVMSLAPVESELAAQSAELATLSERLDEARATLDDTARQTDLSALSDRVAALESDLAARLDDLSAEVSSEVSALRNRDDELAARIDEAERAPLADATDPEVVAALEAYGREVEALRQDVQSQTEANQRLIEEAAAATSQARAAAEAEAEAAAERAARAARQQALLEVQEALDTGAPYAEPLSRIDEAEVPAPLAEAAEDGVPTLAALQADFPEAARDALDAARRARAGDDPGERALTFLQTQLGVRSLEPRAGDSADAILSRAQAAVRSGDLSTAIEELQSLPEPALAEVEGWIERARIRAEATEAADQLAASLATN